MYMHTVSTLLATLENMGEDIEYLHKDLLDKYKKYQKNNEDFDENYKSLVSAIGYNANLMTGIYKNAHLQKQIDILGKIIMAIPPDIRAQYVTPELLDILGE